MGPLVDAHAVEAVQHSIGKLKDEGGEILYGGEKLGRRGIFRRLLHAPCLASA